MNKTIFKKYLKNIAIIILIAIFFITDRYLKSLALNLAMSGPISIIDHVFSFSFTPNYFIAFSLPLSGSFLNILILALIAALIYVIFYLILKKSNEKLSIVLLTIILFGAISNILDRLIYGYVIDYLELRYFTVFNLADIMISGGALLIVLKGLKK